MTVRQRIDQLAAEPPVRDLGYAADQRLVATALLGLQLLADEIDALKADNENAEVPPQRPFEPVDTRIDEDDVDDEDDADREDDDTDPEEESAMADVVDQLAELTAQVKKLTKAVKRSTENQTKEKQQEKKRTKPKQ